MKKLDFIKEKSKVCRIKFQCDYDGIPLIENVNVDFKELVLTSPYEDTILKFNESNYQGYEINTSEKGFMVSLYFFEPLDEEDFDNSINYQFGEGFEVNLEKSDIDFTFKDEKLKSKWYPTIDEIYEREEGICVSDEIFDILDNFKKIIPNKEILTFLYNELLKGLDERNIQRLALMSNI